MYHAERKMKAYHGIQAIVETQALIIINEKLRELSNQIDEAHVCFLPFAAKRIAKKCQMQCFAWLLKQKFTSLLCAFEA